MLHASVLEKKFCCSMGPLQASFHKENLLKQIFPQKYYLLQKIFSFSSTAPPHAAVNFCSSNMRISSSSSSLHTAVLLSFCSLFLSVWHVWSFLKYIFLGERSGQLTGLCPAVGLMESDCQAQPSLQPPWHQHLNTWCNYVKSHGYYQLHIFSWGDCRAQGNPGLLSL